MQTHTHTHLYGAEWWPWLRTVHTELHIKNEQWEWAEYGGMGSGFRGFRGKRAADSSRAMSFSVAEQGWNGLRRRYHRLCTGRKIILT